MSRKATASSKNDYWLFRELTDEQLHFLAGVLYARGKAYIGRGRTAAGSDRWSPVVSIEVPERTLLLEQVFGEPNERRYYKSPSWRYALHDRQRIAEFCAGILPFMPTTSPIQTRLAALGEFCAAGTSTSKRNYIAEHLRAA